MRDVETQVNIYSRAKDVDEGTRRAFLAFLNNNEKKRWPLQLHLQKDKPFFVLFLEKKKELFLLRRRKRSGHFAHVGH